MRGSADNRTVESEQLCHWNFQAVGNPVQGLKGGGIPAAFDEAEKIHRNLEQFGELFLAHLAAESKFSQVPTKLLSERSHLECASQVEVCRSMVTGTTE
jgi:hypothetical protein